MVNSVFVIIHCRKIAKELILGDYIMMPYIILLQFNFTMRMWLRFSSSCRGIMLDTSFPARFIWTVWIVMQCPNVSISFLHCVEQ